MADEKMPQQGLVYNGTEVRAVGERLNLTDMWKAAGSPENREPFNWSRKEGSPFIEAVTLSLNLPVSQVYRTTRGKHGGGTSAHWQIGLAYAKYLSPEFHMWCNTVVRDVMEGKPVHVDALTAKETGGIMKAVVGKALDDRLSPIEAAVLRLAEINVAQEKMLVLMGQSMTDQDTRINDLMLLADSRNRAVPDRVSVKQLLDEAGAMQKGRNGINRRVGNALRDLALTRTPPVPLRRCIHSGVWLFPVDFANEFMRATGNGWVREHNDKIGRQGTIKYPKHETPKLVSAQEARS